VGQTEREIRRQERQVKPLKGNRTERIRIANRPQIVLGYVRTIVLKTMTGRMNYTAGDEKEWISKSG
jgi:hypothetical protein